MLRITHNLIFDSNQEAVSFNDAMTRHFVDKPLSRQPLTRHDNVIVVCDSDYTRLDAAGALDASVERRFL